MTKEELKQEVEEYISYRPMEGTKDFVVYKVKVGENAFSYVVEHKNELRSSDWIKMYEGTERECYRVVGYLDSAEPREKRIAELEQKLETKRSSRIALVNKIAELEAQIERMKCCSNCDNWNWKHNKCEKKLKGDCFKASKWILRR